MLKIDKGSPWVMWPNNLVDKFVEDPANRIFDYDGDFDFSLKFAIDCEISSKSTLFSKLPSYLGIDLESKGFTFVYTYEGGLTEYCQNEYIWEVNKPYIFQFKKRKNILNVYLNGVLVFDLILKSRLASDENSHIIFGAGNFPRNGFNLNYFSVILYELTIKKEGKELAIHDFQNFIHDKSFDITNNCNFIYKI